MAILRTTNPKKILKIPETKTRSRLSRKPLDSLTRTPKPRRTLKRQTQKRERWENLEILKDPAIGEKRRIEIKSEEIRNVLYTTDCDFFYIISVYSNFVVSSKNNFDFPKYSNFRGTYWVRGTGHEDSYGSTVIFNNSMA